MFFLIFYFTGVYMILFHILVNILFLILTIIDFPLKLLGPVWLNGIRFLVIILKNAFHEVVEIKETKVKFYKRP